MNGVSIPVQVESDSITVEFNPNNDNYVELEDGTRFPAIMTQSMADMRVNVCDGPDAAANITSYLLDLKELSFNVINTTMGFMYAGNDIGGTSFYFSMDVMRNIPGIRVEGLANYPYDSPSMLSIAQQIERGAKSGAITSAEYGTLNGILATYNFQRWGNTYWVVDGQTIVATEDTRGSYYIGTDQNTSMEGRIYAGCDRLDSYSLNNFIVFCQKLYGSIDELNSAWGSTYKNFYEIDPHESCSNKAKSVFVSYSRALADLDTFRTLERVRGHEAMIEKIYATVKNPQLDVRLEGSTWLATVAPDSTNPRYRHVYCDQRLGGLLPELLDMNDNVKYVSCYTWDAFRPSEVYELTESSIANGMTPAMNALFNHMREIAINSKYGIDFTEHYNLSGTDTKAVNMNTTVSLFEWWKATYEAGDVPAILNRDHTTDGYMTSVQKKEIEFFVGKLKEAMESPEAQQWATEFENDQSTLNKSKGKYSYDKEFVLQCIEQYYANQAQEQE